VLPGQDLQSCVTATRASNVPSGIKLPERLQKPTASHKSRRIHNLHWRQGYRKPTGRLQQAYRTLHPPSSLVPRARLAAVGRNSCRAAMPPPTSCSPAPGPPWEGEAPAEPLCHPRPEARRANRSWRGHAPAGAGHSSYPTATNPPVHARAPQHAGVPKRSLMVTRASRCVKYKITKGQKKCPCMRIASPSLAPGLWPSNGQLSPASTLPEWSLRLGAPRPHCQSADGK